MGTSTNLGFVAQEVQKLAPELVNVGTDASSTLSLNYIGLIPVTIKAMQEQEITPSISDPAGINLNSYAATIRKRISNPTLKHRAEQIAMDGSQKLSQRIISAMNDL
jgi:hypothetical protein